MTVDAQPVTKSESRPWVEILRPRDELKKARQGLERFSLSLEDLNQKIEHFEKITEKWKERGNLDIRA